MTPADRALVTAIEARDREWPVLLSPGPHAVSDRRELLRIIRALEADSEQALRPPTSAKRRPCGCPYCECPYFSQSPKSDVCRNCRLAGHVALAAQDAADDDALARWTAASIDGRKGG